MAFTQEQFERFLGAIIDGSKNSERLARIEALVKAGNESAEKFRQDLVADIKSAKDSANAAHKRIDHFMIYGTVTTILALAGLAFALIKG